MVIEVTAVNNYIFSNTCNTGKVNKCLIYLLLEDILGTDQAERKPQESVSAVWGIEGGVQGAFVVKLDIPVTTTGVNSGEVFRAAQLW